MMNPSLSIQRTPQVAHLPESPFEYPTAEVFPRGNGRGMTVVEFPSKSSHPLGPPFLGMCLETSAGAGVIVASEH